MKIETLRKIRGAWIKQVAKFDRGQSHVNKFIGIFQLSVLGGIGIELWNKYGIWFDVPMVIVPITTVIIVPVLWLFGWLDQEKIHLTQAENEFNATNLNPFLLKMSERIRKIENKICDTQ